MGKNLRQQRAGKGRYKSPSHRFRGKPGYAGIPAAAANGRVADIIDAPGRTTPLAVVDFAGVRTLQIPAEGMHVGQEIALQEANEGSIVPLGSVPEGSKIYNIELKPGDGGRLCRSSGSSATVVSREGEKCTVLLPSKQKKILSSRCRATVGTAAGSGRTEKPFMKAGTKWYARRATGRLYPRVSGVAMNAVDHPFGGKGKPGKHKTVSRDMPPGRKVGSIAARRMGKKKRK